ncbi:MAG TPA: amidase [Acidimicrobiales bacterium]|nr:amidase [Acidimicrobiales bacterium]
MDFRSESLAGLAARVRSKEISSRELTTHALSRIEATNPQINAFIAVDGDRALAEAAAIDERVARGEDPGPLAGIPIGVKDLEDAAGFVTTHGSPLHADDPPAATDSILVARMRARGCVVLGKTNTPEFGWKSDSQNEVFGATRNPWDLTRSAGGSSGGSGAALAAGMVPLATGSDGGGSIRIPSAINGLSGLKPSLGRVPGGGPNPPGWAGLSTKGPMARCIRDVTYALECVVGPDPTDFTSLPMPDVPWTRTMADIGAPLRVGWSPTLGYAPVDAEVLAVCDKAVRALEAMGTEVVEIPVVFDDDPIRHFLVIANLGTLVAVAPLRDSPAFARMDPGLLQSIEWAETNVTATKLKQAQDACHLLNLRLVEVLRGVSFLITPATAAVTPPLGEVGVINGSPDANWVRFTYPFNLTRSPAGVVNAGYSSTGMPIALQVIGPQHADVGVLRLLALLEDRVAGDRLAPIG